MESFNNRRAPVYAKHGIACSSQPLAATVGRDILKAGGNAADAAIAMAAMVNVTEPMMNGLGGDSFMLVHWKGKFQGLNASGRSGAKFSIAALKAAGFTAMPDAGGATVSVPGALDGYLALHEKFGSMELKDLLERLQAGGSCVVEQRPQPKGPPLLFVRARRAASACPRSAAAVAAAGACAARRGS